MQMKPIILCAFFMTSSFACSCEKKVNTLKPDEKQVESSCETDLSSTSFGDPTLDENPNKIKKQKEDQNPDPKNDKIKHQTQHTIDKSIQDLFKHSIIRKHPKWSLSKPQKSLKEALNEIKCIPTYHPKIFLFQGNILDLKNITIVNAANRPCLGGGGIDGAIHAKAGPELVQEIQVNYPTLSECPKGYICSKDDRIATGGALVTAPHHCLASAIIHTAGPNCNNSKENAARANLLKKAYQNSLKLADSCALKVLAFPMLSGKIFAYPPEEQAKVACEAICDYFNQADASQVEGVILVFLNDVDGQKAFRLYQEKL